MITTDNPSELYTDPQPFFLRSVENRDTDSREMEDPILVTMNTSDTTEPCVEETSGSDKSGRSTGLADHGRTHVRTSRASLGRQESSWAVPPPEDVQEDEPDVLYQVATEIMFDQVLSSRS
jgi:hypothetical protein